ncbi:DDE_Tnp_1 domain-containing protein [Gammaproteobacteria bacterium]
MSALETRRVINAGGGYYLTPLSAKGITPEVLDGYLNLLWKKGNPVFVSSVYRQGKLGERELIAEGFEINEDIHVEKDGDTHPWTERRLIVRSMRHVRAQEANFDERLTKAEAALHDLAQHRRGKKRLTTLVEIENAAQEILERFHVMGFLEVTCHEQVTEQTVRGYADKTERINLRRTFTVTVQRWEEAIQAARRRLGWRVYANNAPLECFSLEKIVLVYRDQFIIERDNSRIKGLPLSLTPFYLQREDHITGMVRLLSIALCALTLFDFLFHQALRSTDEPLRGFIQETKNGPHVALRPNWFYAPSEISAEFPCRAHPLSSFR